jgi:hypothetical protein
VTNSPRPNGGGPFLNNYGRSAVSISSFANGALGEHRRHDTDGMRLEIEAPGCRSSMRRSTRSDLAAGLKMFTNT